MTSLRRRGFGFAALALVLGSACPSAAFADAAEDQAAALMQAAAEAYQKGDYGTCRAKANEAWSKFQHAQISGLLGSCEVKLGMYVEGATHLDYYLKNSTADVNPEAKPLLEEAKQHVSEVTLACHPDAVVFTVDGKPLGTGAETVFLEPGQHVISAEKQGYEPKKEPRSITAGTKVTVNVELERKGALLWPGELMLAVGGVALGTGIGLFGAASAADTTAVAKGKGLTCDASHIVPGSSCASLQESVNKHNTFGNAAIGLIGAGGALVVAGAIYLPVMIVGNKPTDEKKAALIPRMVPVVTNSFAGVVASGQF